MFTAAWWCLGLVHDGDWFLGEESIGLGYEIVVGWHDGGVFGLDSQFIGIQRPGVEEKSSGELGCGVLGVFGESDVESEWFFGQNERGTSYEKKQKETSLGMAKS